MSNVVCIPVWKKDAPAYERPMSLPNWTREKPHLFEKWVIAYAECNDEKFTVRTLSGEGTRTSDTLAVLQAGILQLWENTVK